MCHTRAHARTFDVFIRTQGGKSEAEQRNVFVGSGEAEIPSAMELRGLKDKNFGMPEFPPRARLRILFNKFRTCITHARGKGINEISNPPPDRFSRLT